MVFPVEKLRNAIIGQKSVELYQDQTPVDSIDTANSIKIDNEIIDITQLTNFYNDDQQQTLKAVFFCWLHNKSSVIDYKNECAAHNIQDFKFLVKTELTTWLQGNSDTCKFVKQQEQELREGEESSNGNVTNDNPNPTVNGEKRKLNGQDLLFEQFEKESIDHNMILRGSKNIDFSYLIRDGKSFINTLKRNKTSKVAKASTSKNLKLPIIIISPSSSSLLSLSNIKAFLEQAQFIEPNNPELSKLTGNGASKPTNGIQVINHESDKLHKSAHKITVVDNVDIFTKPEYWDRVIGIFTTGQSWQFNKYKYSNPELLFQRYPGFFLCYQSDIIPKQIIDWNINVIKVDRDKRFRDKMVVKDFWEDIDKILIQRGYGV